MMNQVIISIGGYTMKINFHGMIYTFMGVTYATNIPGGTLKKMIVAYCPSGTICWLDAKECKVVID